MVGRNLCFRAATVHTNPACCKVHVPVHAASEGDTHGLSHARYSAIMKIARDTDLQLLVPHRLCKCAGQGEKRRSSHLEQAES